MFATEEHLDETNLWTEGSAPYILADRQTPNLLLDSRPYSNQE
jgi:hypothetical protein